MHLVGPRPRNTKEWEEYPLDIRESAKNYKPGLVPPTYMEKVDSVEGHWRLQRKYFKEKEKHPFIADIKRFSKVVYNIIFKSMRSK